LSWSSHLMTWLILLEMMEKWRYVKDGLLSSCWCHHLEKQSCSYPALVLLVLLNVWNQFFISFWKLNSIWKFVGVDLGATLNKEIDSCCTPSTNVPEVIRPRCCCALLAVNLEVYVRPLALHTRKSGDIHVRPWAFRIKLLNLDW